MNASLLAWDEVSCHCGSMTMYKFYLHTFFFSSWLSFLSVVIQLLKLKKSNGKKECLDFSTLTFNRVFTATDVLHQISHKASYKNNFWPAPPAPTAPGGQRTLQKAPHKPRPSPLATYSMFTSKKYFLKTVPVVFLQAALNTVLPFAPAVLSIISVVAVTHWGMYNVMWKPGGGWSLWLTPETCFWPGRKWRPLACRHGSWDVAVVFYFYFFFCKFHMIIRRPRLGEDLDPADRL